MKIAVTGGTGFIGRHVTRDLVSRGHEVILIARGQYKRNTQPVEGARCLPIKPVPPVMATFISLLELLPESRNRLPQNNIENDTENI